MENNYTVEDIENLRNFLISYTRDDNDTIAEDVIRTIELCDTFRNDYKAMIKNSPMLVSMLAVPFEDIPLHINDDIDIDQILAMWRLDVGL